MPYPDPRRKLLPYSKMRVAITKLLRQFKSHFTNLFNQNCIKLKTGRWNGMFIAVMYKEDALLTPKHDTSYLPWYTHTLKKQTTNQ